MRNKTKRALQKRKRRKHKQRVFSRAVSLRVSALEVAAGHDGQFRGNPEPVLVCGVFAVSEHGTILIGRGVGRFAKPKHYPTTVKLSDPELAAGRLSSRDEQTVVVLVLALEEDGGRDIARAYGMLQAHAELHLIESCDQPDASELGELLLHPKHWRTPKRVHIMVDGRQFDSDCSSDKWIAAAAFVTEARVTHRVHVVSDDKKNDWTAVMTLTRS